MGLADSGIVEFTYQKVGIRRVGCYADNAVCRLLIEGGQAAPPQTRQ